MNENWLKNQGYIKTIDNEKWLGYTHTYEDGHKETIKFDKTHGKLFENICSEIYSNLG